jgi:hypothetical protein
VGEISAAICCWSGDGDRAAKSISHADALEYILIAKLLSCNEMAQILIYLARSAYFSMAFIKYILLQKTRPLWESERNLRVEVSSGGCWKYFVSTID